jgi:hypothetical protein
VAEASVVEPPVEAAAAVDEVAPAGPFADAPRVTPAEDAASDAADGVPVPSDRRSMGYFAR